MKRTDKTHLQMPNINTTYFLSEKEDSLCPLHQLSTDTFEILAVNAPSFPYTPLEKNEHLTQNLIFTIIFLSVFAFVRLRGKDLLLNIIFTFIKRKKAEILLNEGISSNLICYLLSVCLSFAILSAGISIFLSQTFVPLFSLYLFAGIFAYHFILLLLVQLIGWIFNAKVIANEIIANIWTYHILIGLLVSPFVIALFFVKSFAVLPILKIVIFSLILFTIVKITRWIQILFTYRVSILYMILYLCALEFIPLLVLYKLVV